MNPYRQSLSDIRHWLALTRGKSCGPRKVMLSLTMQADAAYAAGRGTMGYDKTLDGRIGAQFRGCGRRRTTALTSPFRNCASSDCS